MFADRLDSNEFGRFVDNGMIYLFILILKQSVYLFIFLVVTVTVDRLGDAKDQVNKKYFLN